MGNCVGSTNKEKLSQDDLESILAIDPQDWTQGQVIKWLQLTHDGDLRDLVEPFKAQKISGVTFVKLSEENLKNDLEIKQFGLRDGFISARNKLLQRSKTKPKQSEPNTNIQQNDPNMNKDSKPIDTLPMETMDTMDTMNTMTEHNNNAIPNPTTISNQIKSEEMTVEHKQNNNHLITKPSTNRHNQSFENTPDSVPGNHTVNGGYEEIPDTFSPQSQMNGGFNNMPNNAFQDDGTQDEDNNYTRIDFADLHHSDVGPTPHLMPNGHSIHNTALNQNQLYQMNSYQSNQIGFGQMPMAQTIPNISSIAPSITNQSNHHHNHNQTGSNYDELPLEFIHNIPNPSQHNTISGMSGMTGYQEIEFNDTVNDENDADNISSVPSNAPSSNHGVKVTIGSCVNVFDRNTNKWVEAEVDKVDGMGHNVYVKYLNPPHSRVLVSWRDIRQLLPPNHANINNNNPGLQELNKNKDIQIEHVNPSGDHPPIMSIEEKQIHEFARDLWKTLHKIDVKTIPDAHNEPIRGFSGKELVRHVKKHLKKHVSSLNDTDIIGRCSDLVKYQYIRLIASAKEDEKEKVIIFLDSEKFLYQFENEKHREFIKDDQPDRRAWTRGTKVEIYSSTLGGWQTGTVVEVNNDTLTITYGPPTQQMRKTLDRYQDDLVKSSTTFINNRKTWNKDSQIEVYSHGQHIWCQGRIEEVLNAKENQPVDIFRVFYTNNDEKDFSKYVDRWSPDLREVQQLSPKLAKYKKGTKVRVWSNSKQTWVPGVVIDVVPTYEVVNVRYGDHEKLVPVSSDDIKLLSTNHDDDDDDDDNDQ